MKRSTTALLLSFTLALMTLPIAAEEAQPPMRRPGAGPGRMGFNEPMGGDPARMVSMLMKQFDRDGDQKLDASELEKLLVSMRERRMGEGMQRGGRPGAVGGKPGAVGGRPDADGQTQPGGVVPRRPPMPRDAQKPEKSE